MRAICVFLIYLSRIALISSLRLDMSSSMNTVRPCCAATWDFGRIAVDRAKVMLEAGESAMDALEQGVNAVEVDLNGQYYVGHGGLPNAKGVMEFDAAVMDDKLRYGAVMALSDIRTPISVARSILERSPHNILVGEGALEWAVKQGFKKENALTDESKAEYETWKATQKDNSPSSHDTVGMICLDRQGRLAAGTSTSGWKFKHPGRVGDAPLVGSGIYCDGAVGAAVATGDGEEIMRTCLSFLVVEYVRQGISVGEACKKGIERLLQLQPLHTFISGVDVGGSGNGGGGGGGTSGSSGSSGGRGDLTAPSLETMHSTLVVGVLAMDKDGNVGAASTLGSENPHRGGEHFPVPIWRGSVHSSVPTGGRNGVGASVESEVVLSAAVVSDSIEVTEDVFTLKASLHGTEYKI